MVYSIVKECFDKTSQFNLHVGTVGAAFAVTLFGKKTKLVTNNTSVSDFWGRSWNQLVHGALKVS